MSSSAVGSLGPDALSQGSLAEVATTWVDRRELDATEAESVQLHTDRYQDEGELGRGAMGEVRRVRDRVLERTLAMKVLREDRADDAQIRHLFLAEARAMARLEHPGIVPLHDLGTLSDGRPYFTMKEVLGRTLHEAIRALHAGDEDAPGLRALIEVFQRVCEAVAFAHARGVVHRDLKPSNIMIAPFGDVVVLDWGLAAPTGSQVPPGQLMGTPDYMAPEAFLRLALDPRLDVWALGVILYELLSGRRPFSGRSTNELVASVMGGLPRGQLSSLPAWAPRELVALVGRLLQRRPERRPADASEVAAEIAAFLTGARQRELAQDLVRQAGARQAEAERLRAEAQQNAALAAAMATTLPKTAKEAEKRPLWAKEDEASRLTRAAEVAEVERMALLQQALTHAPTLPAAHAGLVEIYARQLADAERDRDVATATQAELLLRGHLAHLEPSERERVRDWLQGDGAVTLDTEIPAEVFAFQCVMDGRRLAPRLHLRLGWTPLDAVPLPMGSWVLLLRAPGRSPVRYPVHLRRGERWTSQAPGETTPTVLPLPAQLPPDQRYVPAGWFLTGGAPGDAGPTPLTPLWCDGFIISRDPITNAEYLAFLRDLDAQGRGEESARWAPRRSASTSPPAGIVGAPGAWTLTDHAEDTPVNYVNWASACAYAAWRAERDGLPWRLPAELEWEKAARGVDGRSRPWGEHADPAFTFTREHHPDGAAPCPVWRFPADRSPYGVRGMGGNVRDWCLDPYRVQGPLIDGPRVRVPLDAPSENGGREARGAHLADVCEASRVTLRGGGIEDVRRVYLGFRIARSI